MDVTIETLDDDENVMFTKTVSDVPLKRNRQTTLSGAIYSSATSASIKINSDWLTLTNVDF